MTTAQLFDITKIRPNWSAFVALITILSLVNSLILILPLSMDARYLIIAVDIAISLILWADFFYLLRKSPSKRHFFFRERGWVVLLGTFPSLRLLRLLWFRWMLKKNGRTFREYLSSIIIKQNAEGTLLVVIYVALVLFEFAIVAVLSFEEAAPGANITSIVDAIWWAMVTVATVGYGDRYPVTIPGRMVGVLLMGVGIALFTVITGSLVEWFRAQPYKVVLDDDLTGDTEDSLFEIKLILERQEAFHRQTLHDLMTRIAKLEEHIKMQKNDGQDEEGSGRR